MEHLNLRDVKALEQYVLRSHVLEHKLRDFRHYATKTLRSHSSDPLRTPRELMVLYSLLLDAESSWHLRRASRFMEKYGLTEKYPWLKQLAEEVKKLAEELEEVEDAELELMVKGVIHI
ncbi:MAG: hypothetical protein QXQ90_07390 [Desulfurococcaceae archaeon]